MQTQANVFHVRWGEPCREFLLCLTQHNMDFGLSSDGELFAGGMDQDSPYWVCAFAKYATLAAIEKANTLSSRLCKQRDDRVLAFSSG